MASPSTPSACVGARWDAGIASHGVAHSTLHALPHDVRDGMHVCTRPEDREDTRSFENTRELECTRRDNILPPRVFRSSTMEKRTQHSDNLLMVSSGPLGLLYSSWRSNWLITVISTTTLDKILHDQKIAVPGARCCEVAVRGLVACTLCAGVA
jgi:hypothetical protein